MSVYSNTELSATVQEKWWMEVDEFRYAEAVVLPRVLNVSKDCKLNDILHLSYEQELTSGDVTAATGAYTPSTTTVQTVSVTVNQWKYVGVEILDSSEVQSFYNPVKTLPQNAGKALAKTYDDALLNKYASFTTNVYGTSANPVTFDDTAMLGIYFKVRNQNIPAADLSFILSTEAVYLGILTKPEFRDADKTGLPASVLTTNYRYKLLGVPVYESTIIPTVDLGKPNLLLHPHALAIGLQKKGEIRSYDAVSAGYLKKGSVAQSLYGLNVFREDHAGVIWVRKQT